MKAVAWACLSSEPLAKRGGRNCKGGESPGLHETTKEGRKVGETLAGARGKSPLGIQSPALGPA